MQHQQPTQYECKQALIVITHTNTAKQRSIQCMFVHTVNHVEGVLHSASVPGSNGLCMHMQSSHMRLACPFNTLLAETLRVFGAIKPISVSVRYNIAFCTVQPKSASIVHFSLSSFFLKQVSNKLLFICSHFSHRSFKTHLFSAK